MNLQSTISGNNFSMTYKLRGAMVVRTDTDTDTGEIFAMDAIQFDNESESLHFYLDQIDCFVESD